ncbi:MAG: DUF3011 domain-containing protein, partial [Steroidobacteraceae bacterium]
TMRHYLLAADVADFPFTLLSFPALAQQAADRSQPAVATPANARSAQSDCNREAGTRGWTVIDTRNYRQLREGWTMDLVVRNRRGATAQGSCFVDGRTGEATLYGIGWGDKPSGNSIEFKCVSAESSYRECQLPIDGRVELLKKLSESPCREGRDWGRRGDRIWVNHGCRAKFRVVRDAGNGTNGGGAAAASGPAQAERSCQREAERRGYRVFSQSAAQPVPGGYRTQMGVRQQNGATIDVKCIYSSASQQVRFEL